MIDLIRKYDWSKGKKEIWWNCNNNIDSGNIERWRTDIQFWRKEESQNERNLGGKENIVSTTKCTSLIELEIDEEHNYHLRHWGAKKTLEQKEGDTCKQLDQERSETKSAIDKNGRETYLRGLLLNAVCNMDYVLLLERLREALSKS